jgi:hypothetical protein
VPRCIHHRRRRLSKIVSAQRRVWCLLLRLLRLKYLFRRASLFPELPYTWSLCDLTTGYFASRSLPSSFRSLPPDRNRLQGSIGVAGRTTRPRLPPICHSAPFQSLRNQRTHLSLSPSRRSTANRFSGLHEALHLSSHSRVFDTPVHLPPTISA